ncbi:MAG: Cys-Gln thioester bond-forming surface protein [Anaerotignum sp.]|nr:Cys-Gln thioester bond-forming surface protein [Anaerotignum sp.]
MAKEKQTRRMIAMALAAAVAMSVVPVAAFAEEETDLGTPAATTTTTTTVSSDGTKTETTTTTQPAEGSGTQDSPAVEKSQVVVTITPSGSDEPSSTETTDTTDTSWSETTEDSSTSFEEHQEDKVTVETDEDGTVVTTTENTVEGEQTTITDVGENNDTTQPDVTVEMIPGETTVGYGETDPVITGPDQDTSDGNWDYTVTDTTTREVTVTTGEITTEEVPVSDVDMESLGPDVGMGTATDPKDWKYDADYMTEYVYEWGDSAIKVVNVVYERDAQGNLVLDENGKYKTVTPEKITSSNVALIALKDINGNRVFAYCVDEDTSTSTGKYYVVENLEDATYFKYDDAKDNLRAIALNGYWGEPDYAQNEDGTQATTPSTGSAAHAKASMLEAIEKGELNYSYNGVEYSSTTEEGKAVLRAMVESVTADDLMVATQAAIWSCANGHMDALHGIDGDAVKNIDGDTDEEIAAKMAFYHYLLNLPGEEKQETTVIDQDSFLSEDGLSITIGEQADLDDGDTRNTDSDNDNDVYNADISFKMVVTPGENDDMIVTLVDSSGKTIREARIAGENKEGENYEKLTADEEGKYTFKDLQLQENSDTKFDLCLEGMQYLEQGVYIYKYHTGNYEDAQTLISVAEGTRDFEVHTTFNVQFDVDENDKTVVKRSWRSHKIKTNDNKGGGGGGNDPKPESEPETPVVIPEEDVPLAGVEDPVEDIGEEDVPLAEDPMVAGEEEIVAATGDSNHMTAGFGGMLMALAGLFGLRKKEN